jgi:hypothetical protein
MSKLLILFIGLLCASNTIVAQEVPVPESLKTAANAKCYWSYSVERVGTANDSLHKYIIRVALQQVDTSGNYKGRLQLKHAVIYCSFSEKGISNKIKFKQVGLQWIANFRISTNQPLSLRIIANYNHHERVMPLTLNKGTYPGEPDN